MCRSALLKPEALFHALSTEALVLAQGFGLMATLAATGVSSRSTATSTAVDTTTLGPSLFWHGGSLVGTVDGRVLVHRHLLE